MRFSLSCRTNCGKLAENWYYVKSAISIDILTSPDNLPFWPNLSPLALSEAKYFHLLTLISKALFAQSIVGLFVPRHTVAQFTAEIWNLWIYFF